MEAFTGYGTVVLMKIYLMLMPLILRGGITARAMGREQDCHGSLYVMGGAWTVYKAGSLLTGLVNEAAGRLEQESNRDAYGAAMLAAAPFRAIRTGWSRRYPESWRRRLPAQVRMWEPGFRAEILRGPGPGVR